MALVNYVFFIVVVVVSISEDSLNGNKEISVQRDIILHNKVIGDETAEIRCRPPTHREQKSQLKKKQTNIEASTTATTKARL